MTKNLESYKRLRTKLVQDFLTKYSITEKYTWHNLTTIELVKKVIDLDISPEPVNSYEYHRVDNIILDLGSNESYYFDWYNDTNYHREFWSFLLMKNAENC